MKKLILLVLMLNAYVYSQNTSQLNANQQGATAERARLFKTYTNFVGGTTGDTTGYVTINLPGWTSDPLLTSVVYLINVATDSIAADCSVQGRNGTLTSVTSTYVDSLVGTSNTSNIKVITLKDNATNRLAGCTQFKVGTVFRASGNGTTTGRSSKWYIMYKFQ